MISAKERSSCLGKERHKSKLAAEYVLEMMNAMPSEKRQDREINLVVYGCEFCKGFHIGHDQEERKWLKYKRKIKNADRQHKQEKTEAAGQIEGGEAPRCDVVKIHEIAIEQAGFGGAGGAAQAR